VAWLTRRYRAAETVSYAQAVIAAVEYARAHPDEEFYLGPLDLSQVEDWGLSVSGPKLEGITDLLEGVPGLVEVDA